MFRTPLPALLIMPASNKCQERGPLLAHQHFRISFFIQYDAMAVMVLSDERWIKC